MAIVSFKRKKFFEKNLYCNKKALEYVLGYVLRDDKTPHRIIGAIGANPVSAEIAIRQFQKVKDVYRNTKGKKVIHFTVSFSDKERKQLEEYLYIGYKISDYFKDNYQIIFALHEDTDNDHIHYAVNTVSYITGKKIRWKKGDKYRLQCFVDKVMNPDFL